MSDAGLEEVLVDRLRLLSRDAPELDRAVRSSQRTRLVAMAAVRSPEPAAGRWRRLVGSRSPDAPVARWRARLTAAVTGAALAVAALSGVLALAQGAEPGDLLYDVKRGTEQTQLALAADSDRGLTLLGFATTRLGELTDLTGAEAGALAAVAPADGSDALAAAGGADPATVRDVLRTMDEQTTEGTYWLTTTAVQDGDAAALDGLTDWTDGQRAGLAELDPAVPEGAREDAARSLALVESVAARAAALQAALGCPNGAAVGAADALGPVPGECLAAGTPAPTTEQAPGTPQSPSGTAAVPGSAAAPVPGSSSVATTAAPTGGGGGAGTGGAGTGGAGTGGAGTGGAAPTTAALPTGALPPVPTGALPVPSSPVVQIPVPLPTTVCVGGLLCAGG